MSNQLTDGRGQGSPIVEGVSIQHASRSARPVRSHVADEPLPVWCIGCGNEPATRRWYPYGSKACHGAAADYELGLLKESEAPHKARRNRDKPGEEWRGIAQQGFVK